MNIILDFKLSVILKHSQFIDKNPFQNTLIISVH